MLIATSSVLPNLIFAQKQNGDRRKPNVVFILTDDLGYGDVSHLNPDSKIKTPCLDALAQEGVYFIAQGAVIVELVSAMDFAPTFINYAGGEIPAYMQGRIFLGKNKQAEPENLFAFRDRHDSMID